MARVARPWRRSESGSWYAQVRGKQVRLGGPELSKTAAQMALNRVLAEAAAAEGEDPGLRVRDLLNLFLDHVERDRAAATYEWYRRFLKPFTDRNGSIVAAEVRPLHVSRLIADNPGWGPSARWGLITAVKRAFRWAWTEGYLASNALARVERPAAGRRETFLDDGKVRAIIGAYPAGDPFRELLTILRETGCRPGEASRVTSADLDLAAGVWVLSRHKTAAKTGRPRVVYLNPTALELCRKLAARNRTGPLFRNEDGAPWTRNAMACRFARLRKRLGLGPEATAYALRHGFVTGALERGVPIATVAELVGHADTQMVCRHYSHLAERREHLRGAAEQATRPGDDQLK